jgi:CelD/BcsL family acetyltransferase involved in cellulose biosynthesis
MLHVRILPMAEAPVVQPIWTDLERRVGGGRLTTSWVWISLWLHHFGDTVRPRFAVFERAGEPVAAVLLVISRWGPKSFPFRRLHLGTAGEPAGHSVFVEYNDLLCADADRLEVARALAQVIRDLPGWDELDLHGFRAETADVMATAIPFLSRVEKSWTMRLRPTESVLDVLPGPTRRLLRQARESLEPGEPELAGDVAAAQDMLKELAALHQARWTAAGKTGAFASDRFTGFLRDLTTEWHAEGRLRLYRLSGREGTLGSVVGFVEGGRFLYYQAGTQQFTDNRKRAGLLCHTVFAEDCRRRGLAEYEFLVGDSRFKRQLSGGEFNPLVWGRYGRGSARAWTFNSARQVRHVVRTRYAAAHARSR